jgi:hypothetical protein
MIQGTLPPVACLEPEVLGALAEGQLAGGERDAAVRHLAGCRRCHEVFASTVQILEEEGALPVVVDAAPVSTKPHRSPVVWFSAAAAALTALVLFVQRAPLAVGPAVAERTPTPTAQAPATPTAAVTPSPVQTASLPAEALTALHRLNGFADPYSGATAVGFAPDPRGRAVAAGISDVDRAARTLARSRGVPAATPSTTGAENPTEPVAVVDDWRRVGRILEASRLALVAQSGKAEDFFETPWASSELTHAAQVLSVSRVPDASWPNDARRTKPLDGEAAQALLNRLGALLRVLH